MDIKSKKLILLAMEMNDVNNMKLSFTYTKIVNLEMFTNVSIYIKVNGVIRY